jgi:hypothetical protein
MLWQTRLPVLQASRNDHEAARYAESRPIKDDGSVCGSGMVDDTADEHIFHHGPVAMKEDNGRAAAALYVMKSHTIRRDEPAFGQISTFSLRCPPVHENG